jgi:hypothetical protein
MTSNTSRRPYDLVLLQDLLNTLGALAGGIYFGDPAREAGCALLEGRLTAWNENGPLPPAFWADKEERDWTWGWYRVSRAEAQKIWPNCLKQADKRTRAPPPNWGDIPEYGVMPDEQAKQYILLWDLAHEESCRSDHKIEWYWLRYINAFLRGDLAPGGIVHFYANYDAAAPRAYVRYNPNQLRAKIENEVGLVDLTIEGLLNWSWENYEDLREFRREKKDEEWHPKKRPKEYFVECHPSGNLGLFVRRDEFEAWQARGSAQDSLQREQPATTEKVGSILSNRAVAAELSGEETVAPEKKRQFIDWAEAEKAAHGSYPPMQTGKHGRDNVRGWAAQNEVSRAVAEEWAAERWPHSRGRPSSKLGSKR